MAEVSTIAWTRSTFNPWIGCTKVGPGCDHCYAEALDKRMQYGKAVHWGAGVPRFRTSEKNWNGPLKWDAFAKAERLLAQRRPGDNFKGPLGFWPVFCASLADMFDNEVPRTWRYDLWRLVEATPNLSWLFVTKRVGNVIGMIPVNWEKQFPDNVRLLITVCNQEEADRDIPKLLALPCKNGISYEPALGPVDWAPWILPAIPFPRSHPFLQWIIVGGESTQGAGKARPFDLAWARSTAAQCKAAGVPVFVKQLGSEPQEIAYPEGATNSEEKRWALDEWTKIWVDGKSHWRRYWKYKTNRAATDPAEWPEDLRIQEFPE